MRYVVFTAMVSVALAACATEGGDGSNDGHRGSLGKADHVSGSCFDGDVCGGQSSGSCWCDELCVQYGDCCHDAAEACSVDECTAGDDTSCPAGESCVAAEPNDCQGESITNCGEQDATGIGLCEQFFGYKWNGQTCVGLSGCSCEGTDCGSLYTDQQACESDHSSCSTTECPDPGAVDVEYQSQDTDTCAVINFTCPDGWVPFSNECGCGCVADLPADCGGLAGTACPDGFYCSYGDDCGAADQTGECAWMPEACTQEYDPVCGCDGQTYGNACMAANAGASVVSQGECPDQPQECASNAECDSGQYCSFGPECGGTGVCSDRPEACTQEYDPVCGCDGQTYGNACTAANAGVSVMGLGECPAPLDSCQNNCGGQSEDGSCWCDSYCEYYGDCCDDKTLVCN